METRRIIVHSLVLIMTLSASSAQASNTILTPQTFNELRDAYLSDPAAFQEKLIEVRKAGHQGLDFYFALRQSKPPLPLQESELLDALCAQKDCEFSHLFWYTDFEQAKQAAQRTGRPILALHLLGKLSDEHSCANSRYFRSVLYADDGVKQALRDDFILYWKSVREVPLISIDFGDGRKLERTITGNSIHYVLDLDGQVVDAIPGLYGPDRFLSIIQGARTVALGLPKQQLNREFILRKFHEAQSRWIRRRWSDQLGDPLRLATLKDASAASSKNGTGSGAIRASFKALTKALSEERLFERLGYPMVDQLKSITSDADWHTLASRPLNEVRLSDGSLALIKKQNAAISDIQSLVKNLEKSIALDQVRNEYLIQSTIHAWLESEPAPELNQLNERVYRELFLTPLNDPWMGLLQNEVYFALPSNGAFEQQKALEPGVKEGNNV